MKKIVVYNKLTPFKGYVAMTIFPFIFARKEYKPLTERTINHESIHLKQQIELLVLPFFLWYGIEWVVRLIQYRNFKETYRNVSFEREAYENEWDDEYLAFVREPFEFLHYLRKED